MGREQQEEVVLFLTAHLPEGFPRVSQPQAGSRQTFRHTFISAVFASSLFLFPFRCFHLMHVWSFCSAFLKHFISSYTIPFPPRSHAAFLVNLKRILLMCLRICATFVCIVLYLYAEADSQSSKACHHRSGSLAVFLSGKSFVT